MFGATTWIESKHEPSLIARNENPPFESRRVRTHPFTVTCSPAGTFPDNACAMDTSAIVAAQLTGPPRITPRI